MEYYTTNNLQDPNNRIIAGEDCRATEEIHASGKEKVRVSIKILPL